MAAFTFSPQELYGSGSVGIDLSGILGFTFSYPSGSQSGSAYFTMETVRNNQGFYDLTSPTNFIGTYDVSSSMNLITSSYIASVVVPENIESSFTFAPDVDITGITYYLRGTGNFYLTIS